LKKNEILEKSRNENFDERDEHIDNESFIYGYLGVLIISVLIIIWNTIHGKPYSDLSSIICASIASASFFKYKKNKRMRSLFAGLLAASASIACLILYFAFGA
jgi:phosphate/sulfate permease